MGRESEIDEKADIKRISELADPKTDQTFTPTLTPTPAPPLTLNALSSPSPPPASARPPIPDLNTTASSPCNLETQMERPRRKSSAVIFLWAEYILFCFSQPKRFGDVLQANVPGKRQKLSKRSSQNSQVSGAETGSKPDLNLRPELESSPLTTRAGVNFIWTEIILPCLSWITAKTIEKRNRA